MGRMGKRDKLSSPERNEQKLSLWKKFKKAFQKTRPKNRLQKNLLRLRPAMNRALRHDLSRLVRLQTELLESRSTLQREYSNSQRLKDQLRKMESKRNDLQQELDNLQEKHVELKMNIAKLETQLECARFTTEQEGERRKAVDDLYKHDQEQLQEREGYLQQVLRREQNLHLEIEKQQLEINILLGNVKQLEKQRDERKQHFLLEQNTWLAREEELQKLLELEKRRNAKACMSEAEDLNTGLGLASDVQLEAEVFSIKTQLLERIEVEESLGVENDILREKLETHEKHTHLCDEKLAEATLEIGSLKAALLQEQKGRKHSDIQLKSTETRLESVANELEKERRKDVESNTLQQRDHQDIEHQKQRLEKNLAEAEDRIGGLLMELKQLEGQKRDLHEASLRLPEQSLLRENSEKELQKTSLQLQKLNRQLQNQKEMHGRLLAREEVMKDRLLQAQCDNAYQRQELEDANVKDTQKEKALIDIQTNFKDALSRLQGERTQQVQLLEERNKETVRKCEGLETIVQKYEEDQEKTADKMRQLKQDMADALKKLAMSEANVEVMEVKQRSQREQLQTERASAQQNAESLSYQLVESRNELARSKEEFRNIVDQLKHNVSALNEQLQQQASTQMELSNENARMQAEVQRLEQEKCDLGKKLHEADKQMQDLQMRLQCALQDKANLEEIQMSLQQERMQNQQLKVTGATARSQNNNCCQEPLERELEFESPLSDNISDLQQLKRNLNAKVLTERKKAKKMSELRRVDRAKYEQEKKKNVELQKDNDELRASCKEADRRPNIYCGDARGTSILNVERLTSQLQMELDRSRALERTNHTLEQEMGTLRRLQRENRELEKSNKEVRKQLAAAQREMKQRLKPEEIQRIKEEIEKQAKLELQCKFQEVNAFLQCQAASHETLEELWASNSAQLQAQQERELEHMRTGNAKLLQEFEEGKVQQQYLSSSLQDEKALKISMTAKLDSLFPGTKPREAGQRRLPVTLP
uniref:ankyrin repeat domain-containing protein 26-like isoform X1 n=1 Tax=Myxine glutinosa TaxID=7769 RepID=UPI00358F477E